MLIVFDLDGTLCDNAAREHLARKAAGAQPGPEKNAAWDEFHAGIPNDFPNLTILETLIGLSLLGHTIELWTARPEKYWKDTVAWLTKYNVPYDKLIMRRDSDWRPSYVVKMEWAREKPPALVFEDHPQTVKLMRAAGITVAQVGDNECR
jgi:hypothetical protein